MNMPPYIYYNINRIQKNIDENFDIVIATQLGDLPNQTHLPREFRIIQPKADVFEKDRIGYSLAGQLIPITRETLFPERDLLNLERIIKSHYITNKLEEKETNRLLDIIDKQNTTRTILGLFSQFHDLNQEINLDNQEGMVLTGGKERLGFALMCYINQELYDLKPYYGRITHKPRFENDLLLDQIINKAKKLSPIKPVH